MKENVRADGSIAAAASEEERKARFWTKGSVVFVAAFISCFLWGSAAPCIKTGYSLFGIGADDTPSRILFAGVRFTLAGIMVIAFDCVRKKRFAAPKKSSIPYVLTLALFQTVLQYVFYYSGVAHTTSVRVSIITASATFFSIFMAAFLFRFEKLTGRKIAGSLLGFAGVVILIVGGSTIAGPVSFAGEGCVIISDLANAMAVNLTRIFTRKEEPVVLSGWQFLVGGLVMCVIGAAAGGHLYPSGAGSVILILYMGFISAGAYTLWGILLKYNDVSRVTILGFMNPVIGVLLSAVILGEGSDAFTLKTFIALALVCAGIVISGRTSQKQVQA